MKQFPLHKKACLAIWLCCISLVGTAQEFEYNNLTNTTIFELLDMARNTNEPDSVRHLLESAYNLANSLSDNWGIQRTFAEWSYFEKKEGNPKLALRYALQVIREGNKSDNQLMKEEMMVQIGSIYEAENLYDKAKDYYLQVLAMLGDDFSLNVSAELYRGLGKSYFLNGQPDSAMIYLNALENYYQSNNEEEALIQHYYDIVQLYSRDNQPEVALKYNLKIKNLLEKGNDKKQLAVINNNIGYNYSTIGDHDNALVFFKRTQELSDRKQLVDEAALLVNLAITYHNLKQLNKAINNLQAAISLLEKRGDPKNELAGIHHLLAIIYLNNNDLYNGQLSVETAKGLAVRNNNQRLLTDIYATSAESSQRLYEYETALDYYKKHLTLRDSFLLVERIRQQDLQQQQFLLDRSEKEIRLIMAQQEVQDLAFSQLKLEKAKIELESEKIQLENETKEGQLNLLLKEKEIQQANLRNKELETERTQQELNLIAQRLEAEKKERSIMELRQREALEQLSQKALAKENVLLKMDKDLLIKDKNLLTQQQEIDRLELSRQKAFRQFVYAMGAIGFLILSMILSGLVYFRRANFRLASQNEQIEKQKGEIEKSHREVELERKKADDVLLNILPAQTARELKEKGGATPRQYKMVTVLFSDFSGFTEISKDMQPDELISELNTCFIKFDEIAEQHNLEKIKTIGDAYMCAGGIPVPNTTNPQDAVAAALKMQDYIQQRSAEKQEEGKPYWKMRVGIHTGRVIAGVVGKKKFAYDIWGDTVNLASRMESGGEEGMVNISKTTQDYVNEDYHCQYRGGIVVKGKEGSMDMFFVQHKSEAGLQ